MKSIFIIFFLLLTIKLQSCNLCLGYPKKSKRLSKIPIEKIECHCNCWKYQKINNKKGYKCSICGHKLIPTDIKNQSNVQKQYQRWKEKND